LEKFLAEIAEETNDTNLQQRIENILK